MYVYSRIIKDRYYNKQHSNQVEMKQEINDKIKHIYIYFFPLLQQFLYLFRAITSEFFFRTALNTYPYVPSPICSKLLYSARLPTPKLPLIFFNFGLCCIFAPGVTYVNKLQ